MAKKSLKISKTEWARRRARRVREARKARPRHPNRALLLDETIASIAGEFVINDPLAAVWHHVTNGLRWAIIDRVLMEHLIAANYPLMPAELAMLRVKLEHRLALLDYGTGADY